jgi:hypothetical protein
MQRQLPAHFRSIIISADLFPLGSDRLSVSLLSWPHLHVNGSHFILFVTARPCAAVVETFSFSWVVASPSLYFLSTSPRLRVDFLDGSHRPPHKAQLPPKTENRVVSCCIIDTSHQKWSSLFSAG